MLCSNCHNYRARRQLARLTPSRRRRRPGFAGASGWALNDLRKAALALHNYHDTFNALPPPGTRWNRQRGQDDNNGSFGPNSSSNAHSWLVSTLPFLEQQGLSDLYWGGVLEMPRYGV